MNKHTYIWSFIAATILLSSCYDSVDNSIELSTEPDTPILVTTAITGSVVDATNNELTNYQLSVGNFVENVESKRFLVQLEDVNKKGQAIYVKDGDQINSLLHTQLIENDINLVELQMFEPIKRSLVSNSGNDLIEINPTISVEVTADKIRDLQGNIPTQEIYVDYRDLSNLNNISQLGASAYNERDQLRSTHHLGAFQLELNGADDAQYSIGSEIDVNISITSTENNISLFHFDLEKEKWNEVAELLSGNNTIQISNTGLYTISQHAKAVYAEGDVNKEGTKVAYQFLSIDEQHLYATAAGRWITLIPIDQDITINTLTPCKGLISSYVIPATSIDAVGIDIEATNDNYYKLQTTVYDCNGELEETTAIHLQDEIDVANIYTFSDTNVDAWVAVCDAEFDISTYDIDTDLKGTSIPWSLDIEDDQGFLLSCANFPDGYSYIKIQDDKLVLEPFKATKVADSTTLYSVDNNIRFRFNGQMADSYQMEDVNVFFDIRNDMFNNGGYRLSCENTKEGCGFTTWNVTHYEAGSENWVRVSFAGEVWMQTIDPPLAGYLPVEGVILTKVD